MPFSLIPYLDIVKFRTIQNKACYSPGGNFVQFNFSVLLPTHSNDASLTGKRVERGLVALSVAANNENFPANIILV
jgi:hypothetical protein